jgi:hypothetical protein
MAQATRYVQVLDARIGTIIVTICDYAARAMRKILYATREFQRLVAES